MAKVTLTFKDNSKGGVDLKYDSDTSVNYATEAMRLAAEAMRTILEKYNGFGKSG